MKSNKKSWLIVAIVAIATATFVTSSYTDQNVHSQQDDKASRYSAQIEEQYPAVDYNAPEERDANVRAKRVLKNSRYERKGLVFEKIADDDYSSDIYFDRNITSMPVKESVAVILGNVLSSAAYLSSDKTGVYSEFQISVDEVIKGTDLVRQSTIATDRLGGFVRYPNGNKILIRVMGMGMPRVGKRYVFFLTKPDASPNYQILTAYEISEDKMAPLDRDGPLLKYKDTNSADFLKSLREQATRESKSGGN